MRPRMNIDVDLVVADTLPMWLDWFKENSRDNVEFDFSWHDGSYHLGKTMKNYMDRDPHDFWRQRDLYDYAEPMANSEEVIWAASEKFDIRFITDSLPEHTHSKNKFLFRHFECYEEIIHAPASEKWEHEADVWVEDRVDTLDNLTETQPNCKVFHMVNDMNRSFEVFRAIRVDNWKEISRRIL